VTARTAAGSRDELVVDQIRDAYGDRYDIPVADGSPRARRLGGGPLLTAATPGGLATAIYADWARRCEKN
jgi:hypothetical protein